ncbi:MAG: hypothetical protein V2A34_06355, partial [Lentisphaerota bacterium]
EARIKWYEDALRTGNPLFDQTLDQKLAEIKRNRASVTDRLDQSRAEKDLLRRIVMMKELEFYKPYVGGIKELEDSTAQEIFEACKKTPEGPPQTAFLKNYQPYSKTIVVAKTFSLIHAELKNKIEAAMRGGQKLKAGALADQALQFWPTDAYFLDTARKTIENF